MVHTLYKTAVVRAINELKDLHLRSKVNDIRSHVQSSLQPDHHWNDAIFIKTLKGLVSDGDIEECAVGNYALSKDFKEKRIKRHSAAFPPIYSPSHLATKEIQGKSSPVRKQEHAKQKIIPKKIYDSLQ